jgi:hypothetical protein
MQTRSQTNAQVSDNITLSIQNKRTMTTRSMANRGQSGSNENGGKRSGQSCPNPKPTANRVSKKASTKDDIYIPEAVQVQMEGIRTRAQSRRLASNNQPKSNGLRQSPRLFGQSVDYTEFF